MAQLPPDCLLFVSTYQAYCRGAGEKDLRNSLFVSTLCLLFRMHWTKYDVQTLANMAAIGLNYNTNHFFVDQCRNSYLQSSLSKLVFFGLNQLKTQTKAKPPKAFQNALLYYKKCLIIDLQQCDQLYLNLVRHAFTEMNFFVRQDKDLSIAEIKALIEKGLSCSSFICLIQAISLCIECYTSIGMNKDSEEAACIVICIFANCKRYGKHEYIWWICTNYTLHSCKQAFRQQINKH